jgi:hypothetical protein
LGSFYTEIRTGEGQEVSKWPKKVFFSSFNTSVLALERPLEANSGQKTGFYPSGPQLHREYIYPSDFNGALPHLCSEMVK